MSAPSTQGPCIDRATAVGPMLNLPLPSFESVAVGMVNVGPTPQINPPDLAGDRKSEGLMSPSPQALPETLLGPGNSDGWLMMGMIVRVIRFHSLVRWIGTTGCTLSTYTVCSF